MWHQLTAHTVNVNVVQIVPLHFYNTVGQFLKKLIQQNQRYGLILLHAFFSHVKNICADLPTMQLSC